MCESSWNKLVRKDFIIDELELKTARETEQDGDSCDASNDGPCSGRSTASVYLQWMTDASNDGECSGRSTASVYLRQQ